VRSSIILHYALIAQSPMLINQGNSSNAEGKVCSPVMGRCQSSCNTGRMLAVVFYSITQVHYFCAGIVCYSMAGAGYRYGEAYKEPCVVAFCSLTIPDRSFKYSDPVFSVLFVLAIPYCIIQAPRCLRQRNQQQCHHHCFPLVLASQPTSHSTTSSAPNSAYPKRLE
jgi:hypothetical protein